MFRTIIDMKSKIFVLALFTLIAGINVPESSAAEEPERTYLYNLTLLRAEPGALEKVIDLLLAIHEGGFYEAAGDHAPFIARHSQGDQWDLALLYPMESFEEYYDDDRIEDRAESALPEFDAALNDLLSFREETYVLGPELDIVSAAYSDSALYHFEMFRARAGKHKELLRQREMENVYLDAMYGYTNLIFERIAGGDYDSLTIGFYDDWMDFATRPDFTDAEAEAAARAAGFENRAAISFYLRELLISHNDSFATKVE